MEGVVYGMGNTSFNISAVIDDWFLKNLLNSSTSQLHDGDLHQTPANVNMLMHREFDSNWS
jgi:hypothetical protein